MDERPASADKPASGPSRVGTLRQIPGGVWVLGCVSLLMDISSEIVHSLLPMFMLAGLGASATTIGLIEGIAEATAPIVKVFSGALSDYLGNRKWLAVAGYGLGALSKPLFAIAPTLGLVVTARVIDRIGKGIRGAPRDALVADITPPALRGAAFGLRQSLDTVGAVLGPLLSAAIVKPQSTDFANESSTDLRSSGFGLLDRNDWFGCTSSTRGPTRWIAHRSSSFETCQGSASARAPCRSSP